MSDHQIVRSDGLDYYDGEQEHLWAIAGPSVQRMA